MIARTIFGTENLGHKGSSLYKEFGGKLHGLQHELGLRESILHPSSTDIGRTIVQHSVGLPGLEMLSDRRATLVGGNVALEGDTARDGLDRSKIDTDDEGVRRHHLGGDLTPRTWGSA